MTFAERITKAPRATDAERGREAVARLGVRGPMADLVSGSAGASPYLADLLRQEAEWLSGALELEPESALKDALGRIGEGEALDTELRAAKRRIAILVALADLGGVWPLERVTDALTQLADLAVQLAVAEAVGREAARGRLPPPDGDAAGLAVLAMGKMGAFELNYSSDIDLICLFDETRFDPDDFAEVRQAFVRAVRRMTETLSKRTSDGYVFRTDLRLRPDASVTPVALSMEAAERYYESFGRTWERAAYIKARAAAGDLKAGQRFLDTLRPFVWRRHLDFAAIQDAHDMRLRIREHKGLHGPISHLGHDVKLGQGGIREIEFFTQTRQIIAGGRDADLRVSGTVEGLARLAEKGWVGADAADQLTQDYRALRQLEHRLQMIGDQQTQTLPVSEAEFAQVADLDGRDPGEMAREIAERFERVSRLTEPFFDPRQGASAEAKAPEMSEATHQIVARWSGYPALRSARADEIFRRVRPVLLARLADTAQPEQALAHFDGFLRGLPAGVQVFSLFEANPQLLDLVVDVVDAAPVLGGYLAANSEVFDAVIGGGFFAEWPGLTELIEHLAGAMSAETDYERKLDRARTWQHEWHFRIGVHHLRGLIDAETAGRQYSELAEACVAALWRVVVHEFAIKHGPPPGAGAAVVGMGSLGGARLNAMSDLDLIVVYDGADADGSDGPRPLATRPYYARLTQALITALSAPTAEGRLYEVDMRLRPSGRQGPVATSLASYRSYQAEEAWTWEHLALTRARPVAGSKEIGAAVARVRAEVLLADHPKEKVLADVAEMRQRLAEAKPGSALDAKAGPGRLTEVELFAQAAALLADRDPGETLRSHLGCVQEVYGLENTEFRSLEIAAELFWSTQAALRLIGGLETLRPEEIGAGAEAFLTRETKTGSPAALVEALAAAAREVSGIIDKYLGSDADCA